MNFRRKDTAMVLCFFLGLLGAHWFYLGRAPWGRMYAIVALAAWPVGLVLITLLAALSPALGAFVLIMTWLAHAGLGVIVIYDFFCLLAMHPARFDREFNH